MLLLPGSSAPLSDLGGKSSTKDGSQLCLMRWVPSDTGLKVPVILLLKSPLWWLKFTLPFTSPHTHPWPTNIQRDFNRRRGAFLMWHPWGTAGLLFFFFFFFLQIFLWLQWPLQCLRIAFCSIGLLVGLWSCFFFEGSFFNIFYLFLPAWLIEGLLMKLLIYRNIIEISVFLVWELLLVWCLQNVKSKLHYSCSLI